MIARSPRSGVRLAAALVVLVFALASARAADGSFPLRLTDPVSAAAVELAPGGGVTHVVFFATWCPPCTAELDRLGQLEARWEEQGYRLVLVAVRNRHDSERLARFVAQRHPPGRLLFDAEGLAESALRVEQLPTHLLFDDRGTEVLRVGSLGAAVDEALDKLLARRGAPAPRSRP